ncbi:Regulator of rDNA transcription protein 5 [Scheffersomyces spartinae]|uniref:Regulator of rDNA transcription protein 5 n=1 Tax=Scheffersomyces spartinae TaxID=45513 RepID=A0A9P8AIC1_9ASCO|nr:Regulator of rDNA transcription protein 5 [Scheffersomyces spartinae]KAG7193499.1 Regulator of rDNA transcription protein 5 [Scheffersomyces spartinae]
MLIVVLIPSYVPRFSRNHRSQSWGIAFAQFDNVDVCCQVINDLNGTNFQRRQINVRLYTPYEGTKSYPEKPHSSNNHYLKDSEPSATETDTENQGVILSKYKFSKHGFKFPGEGRFKRRHKKEPESIRYVGLERGPEFEEPKHSDTQKEKAADEEDEIGKNDYATSINDSSSAPVETMIPSSGLSPSVVPRKSIPTTAVDELPALPDNSTSASFASTVPTKYQLSSDTIFIQNIHSGVTDKEVRTVFNEYNPSKVFIFKANRYTSTNRFARGNLKPGMRPNVNILVTVDVSQFSVPDIITRMKHTKLHGHPMLMKVALLLRVKAIEKISNQRGSQLNSNTTETSLATEVKELPLLNTVDTLLTSTTEEVACIENVQPSCPVNELNSEASPILDFMPGSLGITSDLVTYNDVKETESEVVESASKSVTASNNEGSNAGGLAESMAECLSACKLDWASEPVDLNIAVD